MVAAKLLLAARAAPAQMTANDLYFLEKHAQEPTAETRDIKITVSYSGQGLYLCYMLAQCLSQPLGPTTV